MGYAPDENLPEVVPDQSPQVLSALEARYFAPELDARDPKYPVTYDNAPKYTAPLETYPRADGLAHGYASPVSSIPWEPVSAGGGGPAFGSEKGKKREDRICGLMKKRVFWIILGVVLVVVAAGVGGGVGGGIATARSRESGGGSGAAETKSSSISSPSIAPASSTTSSTASSTTTSSSAPPTPTFLNNQTAPVGFAFQAFSGQSYRGEATKIIRAEGFTDFAYGCSSYVWLPNGTECCVTFCKNETDHVGWWCQPRYQTNASTSFQRIYIGCGSESTEENSRCS